MLYLKMEESMAKPESMQVNEIIKYEDLNGLEKDHADSSCICET